MGAELLERVAGGEHVEVHVPRVVAARRGDGRVVGDGMDAAGFALGPAPVVDELVAGDADQPGRRELVDGVALDGLDRRHEHLGRDVLGDLAIAAAGEQVAVDLADRPVVEREQVGTSVPGDCGRHTHEHSIVASE